MNINETIVRYGIVNEAKKEAASEVKDLGEDIKEYFADKGITKYEVEGWVASIAIKHGKKLNLDMVAKALGGEIPAEFFEDTETVALTVKAAKTKGKGAAPKTAVVAA